MSDFHNREIALEKGRRYESEVSLSSWHNDRGSLVSVIGLRTAGVSFQSDITPTECRRLANKLLNHADDFENRVIDDQIVSILGDSEEVRNTLELLTAGEKSELYPFILAEQDLQRAVAAASSASKKKRAA